MSANYKIGKALSRVRKNTLAFEHHYRIDVFLVVIDIQLLEISCRFKKDVVELLIHSYALNPKDNYISFNVENICLLVNKFYPMNLTE